MSNAKANLSRRFLRFALGGQRFGLAASAVRELRGMDGIVPEAGDDGRTGWLAVGNDLVPVHDLAGRFGGSTGEKILLVDTGQSLVAAVVGHVDGIIEVETDQFHLLPAAARCPGTARFAGVLSSEQAPVLCFNAMRIGDAPTPATSRTEALTPLTAYRPAAGETVARAMVEFSTEEVSHSYRFALSRSQVLELTEPLPVTPLPGAPEHVAGLTLWRDRPVAVVALDRWLGVASRRASSETARTAQRFLVARAARNDEPVAFPVGGDVKLKTPPFEYRDGGTVRMTVPAARVLGWFEHAERTLVVPNLDTLFVPMAL